MQGDCFFFIIIIIIIFLYKIKVQTLNKKKALFAYTLRCI